MYILNKYRPTSKAVFLNLFCSKKKIKDEKKLMDLKHLVHEDIKKIGFIRVGKWPYLLHQNFVKPHVKKLILDIVSHLMVFNASKEQRSTTS